MERKVIHAGLRDGTVVLGKMYRGEPVALTYANRRQAQNAAAKHFGAEVIQRGRPFYVRMPVYLDNESSR